VLGRLLRFVRDASRLGLDPLGLTGLLEATPNFIGVAVAERIAYVNGASQRLLGASSQDELLGRSVYDFVHPDDHERARTAMQEVRSAGSPVPFVEVRLVRKDGTVLDVEVWLAPIRMRDQEAVLIHGRDHSRRRSAERALQESEALYRRLAENNSDIISEYDAEWRLLYVSPSMERVLGYPQNTWVGRRAHETFGEMTHPDDLSRIFALESELDDAVGATTEFVHRARKADGSWCWLHSRGRRYVANGEKRIVVVSRDVTEEQRVLEALRESERRYQTLAQAVPVGIFRIDNKGRHTYLNERWSELTGIPIAEALANPGVRPLHPEDDGKIRDVALRALAEGRPLALEQRIVRPDGQIRWVLMQAVAETGAGGALEGWVGTLTDLSEKRASEQALANSEQRLRLALEGADICTWQWDAAAGRVEWSANAPRVYGLPPGQKLPTTTLEAAALVHPEDVPFAREVAYRQVARGEPFELEFRLAPREGEETRWILMRGQQTPDKTGRAIGISANVTARRQFAQERAALEARLHESQHLESLGLLAGGVAHDFNNLLVGILGNTELALQSPLSDPGLRECIEEIRRSGERAAGLVRQVLAFAGRERVAREQIDLREIVDDTLDALRRSLPLRAKLDWFAPSEPVWVDADATQLRQVVMNLITNACESLPREGGEVAILLHAPEPASPEASRHVEIEVRDTGCGVDAAALGRVFDPFFTTKGAGRGLGLAVAHGIVRAHGGEVSVESAVGRGTCMRVRLPALASESAAHTAGPRAASERAAAPAEGTILVVDDERGVREIARRALESAGYTVLLATDRSEALAHARANPQQIRAILLDLALGNESGETLLASLRELGCTPPVLATSGYAPEPALRRLEAQGIAGFVQKPFTGSSLVRSVGQLLQSAS
jgi:two-component system cell cycle sensor histidine kinase/response regulator CckA